MKHGTEMFYTGIYIQNSKKQNSLSISWKHLLMKQLTTKSQNQSTTVIDKTILILWSYPYISTHEATKAQVTYPKSWINKFCSCVCKRDILQVSMWRNCNSSHNKTLILWLCRNDIQLWSGIYEAVHDGIMVGQEEIGAADDVIDGHSNRGCCATNSCWSCMDPKPNGGNIGGALHVWGWWFRLANTSKWANLWKHI